MDKIIGPLAIVYLVSATVAALWWASDITKRVVALETAPSCQPQGDAKP